MAKEVGLTTDNLQEFKNVQQKGRQQERTDSAKIGKGEINGKEVSWNYNEGRPE